jgi:hypothetical protein
MAAMREEMQSSSLQYYAQEVGQLLAALLAAGRDAEAAQVAEEARRLMPGEALEQALQKAEQEVRGTAST